MSRWPLGVFSSIDAGFGVQLEVARALGVPTVHLHAPHQGSRSPESARLFRQRIDELEIEISCVFAGFDGESYADIPTVQRTVGLVPIDVRAKRTAEFKQIADFARLLDVEVVGLHIGFVPHDTTDADYGAVVEVAQGICDHCRGNSQNVHLETGQEPADVLLRFITDVERENLFINFDPANMILYGCGEPLPALEQLGQFVRSVHCKDATWSDQPGSTWGQEVPLGQGDVDIKAYLALLQKLGYDGPLTIEREISQEPERQKEEIGSAINLLNILKHELGVAD